MLVILAALAAAAEFDHDYAKLAGVYAGAVSSRGIDYELLASRRAALGEVADTLSAASVESFSNAEKLALYVNSYNVFTLVTVLDEAPSKSIMEIDGGKLWDTRRFSVAGESLTLNQLENDRIRKLGDARIHAVVNCASVGCPPLPVEPLRPATVDEQLTAAARSWVATNAFEIRDGSIHLSQVFDWYAPDFTGYVEGDLPRVDGKGEAALWFLTNYAEPATAAKLRSGRYDVQWTSYDWRLNRR